MKSPPSVLKLTLKVGRDLRTLPGYNWSATGTGPGTGDREPVTQRTSGWSTGGLAAGWATLSYQHKEFCLHTTALTASVYQLSILLTLKTGIFCLMTEIWKVSGDPFPS